MQPESAEPHLRDVDDGVEIDYRGQTYLLECVGRGAPEDRMPDRSGEWGPFYYRLSTPERPPVVFAVMGEALVSPIGVALETAWTIVQRGPDFPK